MLYYLYGASLFSISIVPIKVYPFFFLSFNVIVLLNFLKNIDIDPLPSKVNPALAAFTLYLIYVLFVYAAKGGQTEFLLKIFINVGFLISSFAFIYDRIKNNLGLELARMLTKILYFTLTIHFLQVLLCVFIGGLWLLPFKISSSDDAYAIQEVGYLIFGDENKNIWATKILFFYLGFIYISKLFKLETGTLVHILAIVSIVYTSSRTAQLGLILSFASYFIYIITLRIKQNWAKFLLLFSLAVVIPIYLFEKISSIDLSSGHGGDGLLARFFIWQFFLENFSSFSNSELLFGHGIMSVANFVGSVFPENNFHNVLLNQYFDLGLIGMLIYVYFFIYLAKSTHKGFRLLIIPGVFVASMSQYFGYDAELMFAYSLAATSSLKEFN